MEFLAVPRNSAERLESAGKGGMGVIAAALKAMLAAGMGHEAIVAAVADMEVQSIPKDEAAERRKAKDRQRKAVELAKKKANAAAEVAKLAEAAKPKNGGGVMIRHESDQWKAWEKHLGHSIPCPRSSTYAVESEWPPGHERAAS